MKTNASFCAGIALMLSVFSFQTASARHLTATEALEFAIGPQPTVRLASAGKVNTSPSLAYTVMTDDTPTVYVFNSPAKKVWVVSADDAVTNGLLGYIDNAEFDADNIPENMGWMLQQYGQQVAYAAMEEEALSTLGTYTSRSSRGIIAPILATKWYQVDAYAKYTPTIDGTHCPVGCVATAMGMTMHHYKYPEVGTGSIRYKASTLGVYLEYDFSSNPFDWDAMDTADGRASTDESSEAISHLLHACGMASKMNYALSGSGSSFTTASRAMVTYFNYDKGMALLNRDCFTDDEWEALIYTELEANRPVMYSGRSTVEGGHAFVCDGYDGNGYYHFNWGWNGSYNGYFLLSALDPRNNGNGFDYSQSIIIGAQPAIDGSVVRPVLEYVGGLSFGETETIERETYGSFYVEGLKGIFNNSVGEINVTLGLKLVGEDGEVSYVKASSTKKMICGQAITKYAILHQRMPKEGLYKVTPAVLAEDGQWYDMYIKHTFEKAYYVECSAESFVFTPESQMPVMMSDEDGNEVDLTYFEVKSNAVRGNTADIEAHVTNTKTTCYYDSLTPMLLSGGIAVATGTSVDVELSAKESRQMQWSCTFDEYVTPGAYTLAIVDSRGNIIGSEVDVNVESEEPMAIGEIGCDGAEEIMTTEVYNMNGQLVASCCGGDEMQLSSGMYILRHLMADGTVKTEKKLYR